MSFVKCLCGDEFYKFTGSKRECCDNCTEKVKDEEFDSNDSYRCPKCRKVVNISENELYSLYVEDGGDATCWDCEHTFHVNCSITYTFTSPEMEKKEVT